jgi:oxygen-independent coproporphyrinogen-3 oxidase
LSGIYVHIPFCRQACHYCNFHFSTSLRKKDALVRAITREIAIIGASGGSSWDHSEGGKKNQISTVYFGGGTPSLLDIGELVSMLEMIRQHFDLDSGSEITLEANPDDISVEKLEAWKQAGINRLSIGVQSFFDENLKWMNRAHTAGQAINCLETAIKYFDNITMDLIYGIPGLSDDRWEQNMKRAFELQVPHLSCYALTVEQKTPLYKMIRTGKKADVDQGDQSRQFLLLMERAAEAGYEHYEISNFARPGYRSRHNSSYWNGENYLGLGPSAHSYNGTERWWNIANNQQYIDAIEQDLLPREKEVLTPVQKLNEYIMVSLRKSEGIDLERFREAERIIIVNQAEKFLRAGRIVIDGSRLQLTREGMLYADGIAADLFFPSDLSDQDRL